MTKPTKKPWNSRRIEAEVQKIETAIAELQDNTPPGERVNLHIAGISRCEFGVSGDAWLIYCGRRQW